MRWDAFLEQLRGWLDAHELVAPGLRWVVGVSGGPDSTLLLQALHELSRQHNLGWALHVGHMHHGLRGAEADADAEFVAAVAGKLGAAFHEERADIPAAVRSEGGSTEELARERRYQFLERLALRVGSEQVAVAHHADDDAETVLHRICRGTGLRGLAGMRAVRPIQPGSHVRLVRPLLHVRRELIEQLCNELELECRIDHTNLGAEFTRGRVRNVVLPTLRKELNPNVTEALLRLAEQARWLGNYLEDAAARTFDSLVVSEGPRRVVLNTRALLGKQRIIQAEVVRRAICITAGGEQDLGFAHIESVLKLATDGTSGKELHLPGSIVARKQYDRLEFAPMGDTAPRAEIVPVFVHCPGVTELPLLHSSLAAEVCVVRPGTIEQLRRAPNPYEEWLDFERVRPPLLVRGRREGDRFWPLGAPGSKSLGDFLSDLKVDPTLRSSMGVLCDQRGPVWIMPLRIDDRVKLTPLTRRALRLRLTPASGGGDG